MYDFSPMDVNSPCALLQTTEGGPLGSFLMQNRNNPMQIIGMLASFIGLMVIVTIIISTATFMRNIKSNRILPTRKIRKRPKRQPLWIFKNPFKTTTREKFTVKEEEQEPEVTVENINCNNNVPNVVRHWTPPPPPCAPSLPPPPPNYIYRERQWTVPTVSSSVAPKPRKKLERQDTMNKALVSELKMRLEQKKMKASNFT